MNDPVVTNAKISLYSREFVKAKDYITRYNYALKKIWKTPYDPGNDYQILQEYGLGRLENYSPYKFTWNNELKGINDRIFKNKAF